MYEPIILDLMLAMFKYIGLSFSEYIPSQCPPAMSPRRANDVTIYNAA